MSLFSPSFLRTLRESHDAGNWPGVLADPDMGDVREALDQAVACYRPDVRSVLERLLTSEAVRDLFLGRALLFGLHLAAAAGAEPERISKGGVARMRTADGTEFFLAPLLFHTGTHRSGQPGDVARLIKTLESVFANRPFALHIRHPLSSELDPEPIARAVQLWLRAVDRGEWQGKHAVYEDDRVSIELTLLDLEPDPDKSPLAFFVGPSAAMEQLAVIDTQLQALIKQHDEQDSSLPIVPLLAAHPSWDLGRGFLCQLLYGTADATRSERDDGGTEYCAVYATERFSLFADPVFRKLAGLWWVESVDAEPLEFRAWAHENPWCSQGVNTPTFPGLSYRRAHGAERGALGTEGHAMTWDGSPDEKWRLGPCT